MTRQSIPLTEMFFPMDARVKPAHDESRTIASGSLSFRADCSDHLAEALGFGRDERRELRRRGGDRLGALLRHLLDDIWIPHRPHECRIELVDTPVGRAARGDTAEP